MLEPSDIHPTIPATDLGRASTRALRYPSPHRNARVGAMVINDGSSWSPRNASLQRPMKQQRGAAEREKSKANDASERSPTTRRPSDNGAPFSGVVSSVGPRHPAARQNGKSTALLARHGRAHRVPTRVGLPQRCRAATTAVPRPADEQSRATPSLAVGDRRKCRAPGHHRHR